MKDLGRVTLIACFLLVTLRLFIGWQLLYEGTWKIKTLSGPRPWSAVGYLRNAQGPMRDHFRHMTGDPDELKWLDFDTVAARWDNWQKRFEKHYQLSDRQKGTLNRWINGSKYFTAELEMLPEGINFTALRLDTVLSYDSERKILKVDGKNHLRPNEKQRVLDALDEQTSGANEFSEALAAVYKRSKDGLSFKEKLGATVRGNPDWIEKPKLQQMGEIGQYKTMLAAYQRDLSRAEQDFQWDHLDHTWGKIQAKRAQLVGPVKALEGALKDKAEGLLSVEQMALGPVSKPWTSLRISDTLTIVGLAVLGAMLMLGLGTRLAAVMAAGMLFMFYLAMPPWPGVPEIPGPEHSFIVNKNLIEVAALLAIAALPTGRWFGVDGMVAWLRGKRKRAAKS